MAADIANAGANRYPALQTENADLAEIWAFRWRVFDLHIEEHDGRRALTEFIGRPPIVYPLVHQLREARWAGNNDLVRSTLTYWSEHLDDAWKWTSCPARSTIDWITVSGDVRFGTDLLQKNDVTNRMMV